MPMVKEAADALVRFDRDVAKVGFARRERMRAFGIELAKLLS